MELILLAAGILTAVFVGINIGGSSTGVAFGPAVGSNTLKAITAAALMSAFALLGGWTVGRNVIATMGGKIVPSTMFTLEASIILLFFVGLGLLVSNLAGVPASTSMTAVGAIAGLGLATNTLDWAVMGRIVSWWLVAPVIAFMTGSVIGRYLYPHLDRFFHLGQSEGALIQRTSKFPFIGMGPGTTSRELVSTVVLIAIACFMAFSAGASNVANAVAPLVGSKALSMNIGILLGVGAISVGAFTIARRTLATVGEGITDLPLLAALIVSAVSASIITLLSVIGIPASLAISSTMCITGLGWGRATRTVTLGDTLQGETPENVSMAALKQDSDPVERIGDEDPDKLPQENLFNPGTVQRVVTLWVLTPTISATASFLLFTLL